MGKQREVKQPEGEANLHNSRYGSRGFLAGGLGKPVTVDSDITHTSRDRSRGMGFGRVWVVMEVETSTTDETKLINH